MKVNRKNRGNKMKIQHWKVIAVGLMVYDLIAVAFSYFFGLWLRFDFHFTMIPTEYLHSYTVFIPFYGISVILFFWFMRMYRGVWRFAGFRELLRYASASLIASMVHVIVIM
ncbi:MAG: polysaccharide biosynthesis protein, partial [Lachnospiraceae bacterium]|nr:polysaccharide biosynthesis protein [Lachnospiraceae bacterium]